MKYSFKRHAVAAGIGSMLASTAASAVEMQAGDWKFTANGNVNVHYIHSTCENKPQAIVTVGSACAVDVGGKKNVSTVSNGLLPAVTIACGLFSHVEWM